MQDADEGNEDLDPFNAIDRYSNPQYTDSAEFLETVDTEPSTAEKLVIGNVHENGITGRGVTVEIEYVLQEEDVREVQEQPELNMTFMQEIAEEQPWEEMEIVTADESGQPKVQPINMVAVRPII